MRELVDLLGVGVEANQLTIGQVSLRAIIIFFATLLIVRIANKRFFAKKTAFDIILGFILASMMARAVNGSGETRPRRVSEVAVIRRAQALLAMC